MARQEKPATRKDVEARIVARAWADADFAEALRQNPRKAISAELGVDVPNDLTIVVHEERPDEHTWHLVIPPRPAAPDGELSEAELAVAGGVRMESLTSWSWLTRSFTSTTSTRTSIALDPGLGP